MDARRIRRAVRKGLGELATIVAGVLIALWANAWLQSRADRRHEAENLMGLRADFKASQSDLAESNRVHQRVLTSLENLLTPRTRQQSPDSIAQWLYDGLFRIGRYRPRLNSLRPIESADQLRLFPRDFQYALSELDRRAALVDNLDQDLAASEHNLLEPFMVKSSIMAPLLVAGDSIDPRKFRATAIDAGALSTPEAVGIMTFKLSVSRLALRFRRDVGQQLDTLLQLTEKRLAVIGY
jgi:hypothetical protein